MTALAAAVGVGLALLLCVMRLFSGPTLYDRTLAMNGVVTKIAVIAAAVAVATGRASLVDAAFAFLFASVIANVAALKFFRSRSFQPPLMRAEER
ncbi:MAG: cation:proton antiporter [Hyphomonadaceae bacterium]|nr:cation:proton antiporter [Hyphomonadaceae bacterium]MCA8886847.1 cation:proton antiporter [Hyphomonadaceae bacterium]